MDNTYFSGDITSSGVKFLIFYFPLLLLFSVILTILILLNYDFISFTNSSSNSKLFNQFTFTVVGSISTSLMGCSIFYTRKLYKILLSNSFNIITNSSLKSTGTLTYFIMRPLFSTSFTLLLIIVLNAGLINLFKTDDSINSSFTDLCMFISFFLGFSSGKFLQSIEKKAGTVAEAIFK